jgi:serine/threonine-protein kinase RsbT
MLSERTFLIESDQGIAAVRRRGREIAARLGFSASDQIAIVTAISELAHNILEQSGRGAITISVVRPKHDARMGLQAVARDEGSENTEAPAPARDGVTAREHAGQRLLSTRRIVDEFELTGVPGEGTTITIRKWPR